MGKQSKKLLALVMVLVCAFVMVLALTACGEEDYANKDQTAADKAALEQEISKGDTQAAEDLKQTEEELRAELNAKIDALKVALETLDATNKTTLEEQIANLSAAVATLDAQASVGGTLDGYIGDVKDRVSVLEDSVNGATGTAGLAADVLAAQEAIDALETYTDAQLGTTTSEGAVYATIKQASADLKAIIGTVAEGVTLQGEIDALTATVAQNKKALEDKDKSLDSDIAGIKKDIADNDKDIDSIDRDVENINKDISSINSTIARIQKDITTLGTNISALDEKFAKITGSSNTNIEKLNKALEEVKKAYISYEVQQFSTRVVTGDINSYIEYVVKNDLTEEEYAYLIYKTEFEASKWAVEDFIDDIACEMSDYDEYGSEAKKSAVVEIIADAVIASDAEIIALVKDYAIYLYRIDYAKANIVDFNEATNKEVEEIIANKAYEKANEDATTYATTESTNDIAKGEGEGKSEILNKTVKKTLEDIKLYADTLAKKAAIKFALECAIKYASIDASTKGEPYASDYWFERYEYYQEKYSKSATEEVIGETAYDIAEVNDIYNRTYNAVLKLQDDSKVHNKDTNKYTETDLYKTEAKFNELYEANFNAFKEEYEKEKYNKVYAEYYDTWFEAYFNDFDKEFADAYKARYAKEEGAALADEELDLTNYIALAEEAIKEDGIDTSVFAIKFYEDDAYTYENAFSGTIKLDYSYLKGNFEDLDNVYGVIYQNFDSAFAGIKDNLPSDVDYSANEEYDRVYDYLYDKLYNVIERAEIYAIKRAISYAYENYIYGDQTLSKKYSNELASVHEQVVAIIKADAEEARTQAYLDKIATLIADNKVANTKTAQTKAKADVDALIVKYAELEVEKAFAVNNLVEPEDTTVTLYYTKAFNRMSAIDETTGKYKDETIQAYYEAKVAEYLKVEEDKYSAVDVQQKYKNADVLKAGEKAYNDIVNTCIKKNGSKENVNLDGAERKYVYRFYYDLREALDIVIADMSNFDEVYEEVEKVEEEVSVTYYVQSNGENILYGNMLSDCAHYSSNINYDVSKAIKSYKALYDEYYALRYEYNCGMAFMESDFYLGWYGNGTEDKEDTSVLARLYKTYDRFQVITTEGVRGLEEEYSHLNDPEEKANMEKSISDARYYEFIKCIMYNNYDYAYIDEDYVFTYFIAPFNDEYGKYESDVVPFSRSLINPYTVEAFDTFVGFFFMGYYDDGCMFTGSLAKYYEQEVISAANSYFADARQRLVNAESFEEIQNVWFDLADYIENMYSPVDYLVENIYDEDGTFTSFNANVLALRYDNTWAVNEEEERLDSIIYAVNFMADQGLFDYYGEGYDPNHYTTSYFIDEINYAVPMIATMYNTYDYIWGYIFNGDAYYDVVNVGGKDYIQYSEHSVKVPESDMSIADFITFLQDEDTLSYAQYEYYKLYTNLETAINTFDGTLTRWVESAGVEYAPVTFNYVELPVYGCSDFFYSTNMGSAVSVPDYEATHFELAHYINHIVDDYDYLELCAAYNRYITRIAREHELDEINTAFLEEFDNLDVLAVLKAPTATSDVFTFSIDEESDYAKATDAAKYIVEWFEAKDLDKEIECEIEECNNRNYKYILNTIEDGLSLYDYDSVQSLYEYTNFMNEYYEEKFAETVFSDVEKYPQLYRISGFANSLDKDENTLAFESLYENDGKYYFNDKDSCGDEFINALSEPDVMPLKKQESLDAMLQIYQDKLNYFYSNYQKFDTETDLINQKEFLVVKEAYDTSKDATLNILDLTEVRDIYNKFVALIEVIAPDYDETTVYTDIGDTKTEYNIKEIIEDLEEKIAELEDDALKAQKAFDTTLYKISTKEQVVAKDYIENLMLIFNAYDAKTFEEKVQAAIDGAEADPANQKPAVLPIEADNPYVKNCASLLVKWADKVFDEEMTLVQIYEVVVKLSGLTGSPDEDGNVVVYDFPTEKEVYAILALSDKIYVKAKQADENNRGNVAYYVDRDGFYYTVDAQGEFVKYAASPVGNIIVSTEYKACVYDETTPEYSIEYYTGYDKDGNAAKFVYDGDNYIMITSETLTFEEESVDPWECSGYVVKEHFEFDLNGETVYYVYDEQLANYVEVDFLELLGVRTLHD